VGQAKSTNAAMANSRDVHGGLIPGYLMKFILLDLSVAERD